MKSVIPWLNKNVSDLHFNLKFEKMPQSEQKYFLPNVVIKNADFNDVNTVILLNNLPSCL